MNVLIVEDETAAATNLKALLLQIDPSIRIEAVIETVVETVRWVKDNPLPDLIFMDIQMPKMDGYEVCKKIREKKNTPIIMLTARAEELDKVLGLELGADDYVTKPFGVRELMARVKANLRKSVVREETSEQAPAGKGNFSFL